MDCKIDIIPRVLHFKQPAGTSRGTYTTRKVWYLHFTAPEFPNWVGIGECAPLPNLSCDDLPDYEEVLAKICRQVENQGGKLDMEALCKYPSILFGLETAILLKSPIQISPFIGIPASPREKGVSHKAQLPSKK